MKAEVDAVLKAGDTVGGVFEIVAHNVPVGLGSHAQWDEKLDGRLAQAVMSIQAVKGVEIGAGILAAGSFGSEVQDEISYDKGAKKFTRSSNRAGGLEGGITNGEDVVVRGYLKPISTLRRALKTADMETKEPVAAAYERSDWCVVPAAGVTGGKDREAKIVLVNPEIIHAEGEKREEEGCLSIPGFRGYVVRPQFVTVKAQNAKGETFEIRGEDLLARAFCHEIDHLNGVLFIQHLSMLKRDLIKRKIKKLRKQGEW